MKLTSSNAVGDQPMTRQVSLQSSGLKIITNSIKKKFEERNDDEPLTAADEIRFKLDNLLLEETLTKPAVSINKMASLLDDALIGIMEDNEEQEFNPYGLKRDQTINLVGNKEAELNANLSPDLYSLNKDDKEGKTYGVLSDVLTDENSPHKRISPTNGDQKDKNFSYKLNIYDPHEPHSATNKQEQFIRSRNTQSF